MTAVVDHAPHRRRATAIGAIAVLLWATLAAFTAAAGKLPPFQLTALTFAIAFAATLGVWAVQGKRPAAILRQPPAVWALGIAGLFGYHALYFAALNLAPPAQASLICYLWPLLIVLGSTLVTGEALRWWHVIGAVMGLAGTALLIGPSGFSGAHALGYVVALGCALTWSGYSILSRRVAHVPSDAVGGFVGATAVLATLAHLAFEGWVAPTPGGWLAIVALGLGPVGLAFFVWDHGVKHGDVAVLGALAYLAPPISTLILVATGLAEPSWGLAGACLLIAGGAALAAKDVILGKA
jgi:drug/metabolite transporter (DMT)-like permease